MKWDVCVGTARHGRFGFGSSGVRATVLLYVGHYGGMTVVYARVADSATVEALFPEHAGTDLRGG